MVSESVIAEARRKALRNGDEDPVAVAQRYLNVYRQMHIFSQEKKDEFDQSLLNLQPITISIISSLPGGLTFQDYIDEVLTKAGRSKSAREGADENIPSDIGQPQILANAQASVQPQQIVAPVMSGEAKLSMGKEFADEFAKIMSSIVAKQTIMQKDSLAKVAQDLGKTQLFIAKKLEDNKVEHQAEISELCKTIAQSHTALSTSLANLSENIVSQKQENNLVSIPSVERRPEDDVRLVEMITQSQERMMSGLLARLPQAVGVGNVNVNAPSRSIEDDARLAEMIAQSQEKVLTKLLEKLPQSNTIVQQSKNSENIEEIMTIMAQSQEKLISALAEKLPQMTTGTAPSVISSVSRTPEDDERLVEMITKSQEKLLSALLEKMPQSNNIQKNDTKVTHHSEEDDERLVRLIASTQENMIKSLIEKNILVAQSYPSASVPAYNPYQNTQGNDSQYYYNAQPSENNYSNMQQSDEYQSYAPNQNTEAYNQDNVDFSMFTPVDEANDISSIIYDASDNNDFLNNAPNEEQSSETKKKKKKKKKKKNNNLEENVTNNVAENTDDDLGFLDNIKDDADDVNFDDITADVDVDTLALSDSYPAEIQEDTVIANSWEDDNIHLDEEIADFTQDQDFENTFNEEQANVEDIVQSQEIDDSLQLFDVNDNVQEEPEIYNEDYGSEPVEVEENVMPSIDDNTIEFDDLAENEEDEFDDKWLNFEDEEFADTNISADAKHDEPVADWNTEDDSWGFANDDNTSSASEYPEEDGWEYVEDDGSTYSEEDGWEYVEDDGSTYSEEDGWEYVEDDGSTYSEEDSWEYVEAIDDKANIYSSDSFSQNAAPVVNMFSNSKEKIQITNIPQIHNEANDDEIDDPYKNSILKD